MTMNPAPPRPTNRFRPLTFNVAGPARATTTTRPKGPIFGPEKTGPDGAVLNDPRGRPLREILGWSQPGKSRACWDLTITCDGHEWFDRHYASGHAQAAKERLEAAFRDGWEFDPKAKRFVPPDQEPPDKGLEPCPTVFTESVGWWRAHWSTIEPKSRQETLRYISRPILELMCAPGGEAPAGLERYLAWQLLPPKPVGTQIPLEHQAAASWLASASLPVEDATVAIWQAYVDRWRVNTRTGKPLTQSSLNRHLSDVRQLWVWVCAVHQLPNPWELVKTGTRSSAGGRRSSTVRPVDRTIVLAPNHVRELAAICGDGPFGPLAEVYVLLLGIAGGRPGESAGVHRAELRVPPRGMGEVLFKRTNRRGIDPKFLDVDDDPVWGPLKGREIEEDRTAPLPSTDANRIYTVLQETDPPGALFAGWDWDKFARDVWTPAKIALAAAHNLSSWTSDAERNELDALRSALDRLRLHDLRHAACSMWLNTPGMEVRVACEWSGHKRLSVFLDIYQGLMPGSQGSAREKLEDAWGAADIPGEIR
jgi:hypothetical protein